MGLLIGIDLGTSGFRAQAIDSEKGIISTAISLRHPLPGVNVLDHLYFAMESGMDVARKIVVGTVNEILNALGVDLRNVERLAVCGNPTQLSIFQGIEIRDLAFGGERKLQELGVRRLKRKATVVDAGSLGLASNSEAEVCIPPAVRQQVGADALAMLIKSGILEHRECCMVTDFGTNAEIGLKVGDKIYTGSCAAGPAIEGGEIEKGILAAPCAISDSESISPETWKFWVLDKELYAKESFISNLTTGDVTGKCKTYVEPMGITGTGTIAMMVVGLRSGLLRRDQPYVMTKTGVLRLNKDLDIYFTKDDYINATRCFGAFKAGHVALVEKAGVSFDDIKRIYMCGASGTYVDALKAQVVGLVPPTVREIYQVGNTSLAMADAIAINPEELDRMQEIADVMKPTYYSFVEDQTFKMAYILEMDYWERGLILERKGGRRKYERIFNLVHYPEERCKSKIYRIAVRDIPILGEMGLHVIPHVGAFLIGIFKDCKGCRKCEEVCMENALRVIEENGVYEIVVATERCTGRACMKCELECPANVFRFEDLKLKLDKDFAAEMWKTLSS